MKSILDPSFCYTPSVGTDLRKTFARVRGAQPDQRKCMHCGAVHSALICHICKTPVPLAVG